MALAIGVLLALAVGVFAWWTGLDRDRAFYPTVLIVVASYYILFAVMGGSTRALVLELMAMAVFVVLAVVGFKTSPGMVVAGLAGHGVFDFVHASIIDNPGVPGFWPPFCMTYDVGAAAWLAWRLRYGHPRPFAP